MKKRLSLNEQKDIVRAVVSAKNPKWQSRIEEVISLIIKKLNAENILGWALVINKPLINQSDVYFIYPNMTIELVKLDRLASRSRDVIPKMKEL